MRPPARLSATSAVAPALAAAAMAMAAAAEAHRRRRSRRAVEVRVATLTATCCSEPPWASLSARALQALEALEVVGDGHAVGEARRAPLVAAVFAICPPYHLP